MSKVDCSGTAVLPPIPGRFMFRCSGIGFSWDEPVNRTVYGVLGELGQNETARTLCQVRTSVFSIIRFTCMLVNFKLSFSRSLFEWECIPEAIKFLQ
jgi:hypothetical protein